MVLAAAQQLNPEEHSVYPQNDLYQAILARRSVRRYEKASLDEATLAQVQKIVAGAQPLVPDNRFEVLTRDVQPGENLVSSLGGYGRIVTPPHYLVPYAVGERHLLVDLGHRVEQIAVRLTMIGVGTCYIGSLRREAAARERFSLSAEARIGAFLIFGQPSTASGGRAFNTLMRRMVGATNKLPAERIFFRDTFDTPATPPPELAPLIEAARNAPSAVNAQPWRFLWRDGQQLHLFVTRNNPKYGLGATASYCLYDGGICMGNVALALEALGMEGRWVMVDGTEPDIPDHPADLHPLAMLVMSSE
jgi:nitroreductase